jgi:hypothetical protein
MAFVGGMRKRAASLEKVSVPLLIPTEKLMNVVFVTSLTAGAVLLGVGS